MTKPSITVLVPTFNRAEQLRQTLEGLRQMSVPPEVDWELIVVDNNSIDETRAVVEEFSKTSSIAVRYVFEPRKGKSNALNLGVKVGTGDIVSILDDDVIPATDWLANIFKEFSSDNELGALCGRIELFDPQDLPLMLVTDSTRRVAKSYDDLDGRFGGCIAIRRPVLDGIGRFDTLLGSGAPFRAAVDVDYAYRIWRAGWKMLYAPSVLAFHNHGRRTAKAERSLFRAYNFGAGAFYGKHAVSGDVFAVKLMYWMLDGRARELLRGRDIARNLRGAVWVINGFIGCAACQCWRAVWR